jgi:hypothetical protein
MEHLKELINEPPYLVSFFVSTILLILSLIHLKYFNTFLAVFLYSLLGVVWRHAVKDSRGWIERVYPDKASKTNFWITIIYQIANLIIVGVLIVVIVKYCI